MNDEIYSVDARKEVGYAIYGGGDNTAEIYDFINDRTVTKIEDFSDSVLYVKFLDNGNYILVTIDGDIALMSLEDEVSIIKIEEDITVAHFNEKLVIGTQSGKLYLYDEELEHINTLGGHENEIICVDYHDGKVYSMSTDRFMVHDEYGRPLVSYRHPNASTFKHMSADVLCTAQDNRLTVSKNKTKLFETTVDGSIESIEYINKTLVVGGDFEYIMLIETSRYYSICKLETKLRISKLKALDENRVVFSTICGLIGLIDIRNAKSLKVFEGGVETIFDFAISDNTVVVGGEKGINFINLKSEPLALNFDNEVKA